MGRREAMGTTATDPRREARECGEFLAVRSSPSHGLGVFATRDLAAGTRVLEYTGERISHAEGAARYDDERGPYAHTLLFTVDRSTVIDAGAGGGPGRYVNHSCEPNCEAVLEHGRVFFETIHDVPAGGELTYDYRLRRPQPLPRDWRRRYACHCAASRCRRTMLVRPPGGVQRVRSRAHRSPRSRPSSSEGA
jgi:SET domain-containing protein